jgi:hypothetical protein
MPQKKSLASVADTFFIHDLLSDTSFDFQTVRTGFAASHGRYPFTLVAKTDNRAGLSQSYTNTQGDRFRQ